MKSKFSAIIMGVIIFLIICVIFIFGVIIIKEVGQSLNDLQTSGEPEDFKTVISDTLNTIDNNIEAPEIIENPLNKITDNSQKENTIDYSSINIDKYFYNQLEESSKFIYKAFESNKEEMKTGTHQINLGNKFSDLLEQEDGQKKLGDYYQSAIEAYTYDNPEVFYLSPNKMYLNIETTTFKNSKTYNVYISSGKESNYLIDEYSSKEQVQNDINKIEQVKNNIISNKTASTYDNIKMVHDYLVNNVEYDSSVSKENIYNVYGALVNNIAVCEGYARSFKYIMDNMQIPCVLVIGKGTNSQGQTENHAWNYVMLNNVWYAVDTTWDDPIISGNGIISKSLKYKYFLKGNNTFSKDHIPSGQFTPNGKIFKYPLLNEQDY